MKKIQFTIILFLFSIIAFCGEFSFAVLNVGQGLNVVVQSPDNKVLIYDCGTSDFNDIDFSQNELCFDRITKPYLNQIQAKDIEYMCLSHPHTDHYVGLIRCLNSYNVKHFLSNGENNSNKNFRNLMNKIRSKNIPISKVYYGLNYKLGKEVDIFILAPIPNFHFDDPDNNSIVMKITYKNQSFLLMGDVGEVAEPYLIQHCKNYLKSNVLVCGGHGTKYSSTENFLKVCQPKYAIISCGKNNPYHLPHSPLLKRLKQNNIYYYRTDTKGNIIVKVKDDKLIFNTIH